MDIDKATWKTVEAAECVKNHEEHLCFRTQQCLQAPNKSRWVQTNVLKLHLSSDGSALSENAVKNKYNPILLQGALNIMHV